MKATKRQLRRIIKEEAKRVLSELSGPTRNDLMSHYNAMNTSAEPNRGAVLLYNVITGPSYSFFSPEEVYSKEGVESMVEMMSDSQVQQLWDNILASDWVPGEKDYSLSAEDMSWGIDESILSRQQLRHIINEIYETRPGHIEAKYALVKNGYNIDQPLSSPQNDAAITDALEHGRGMRDDFNYDDIVYVVNHWEYFNI
jgi:hypothetical protein